MQLSKIIAALRPEPVRVDGPADREVTALTHDSRQAVPGTLFVALPSVTPGRTGEAAGEEARGEGVLDMERTAAGGEGSGR